MLVLLSETDHIPWRAATVELSCQVGHPLIEEAQLVHATRQIVALLGEERSELLGRHDDEDVGADQPPVYELAERFVVTATAMIVRLEELELAHRDTGGVPRSGTDTPPGLGVLFPA